MQRLAVAIQFLTRIPVPGLAAGGKTDVGKSAALFPAVGLLIGAVGSLIYYALRPLLPASTCVIIVLAYSAFITNAFHEDGLADTFDGFGGGWDKQQSLRIMRDSRIGTFGALALILVILGKYNLLSLMEWPEFWRWFVFANTASRWSILPLSMFLDYAREEGQGKIVARRVGAPAVSVGGLTMAAAAVVFPLRTALAAIAVACIIPAISGIYYRRRLGGVTGDCLGATNQLTEVALYLTSAFLTRRP